MPVPSHIKVIDMMIALPIFEDSDAYGFMRQNLRDKESLSEFKMPAQYMFKDIPQLGAIEDKVEWLLGHMDRFNIERGLIGINEQSPDVMKAYSDHRERFFFELPIDPNEGMEAVRTIRRMKKDYGISAVTCFPVGCTPQVPLNDKKMYPIYMTCIEEGLPFFSTVGVPGPRLPMMAQHAELIDEVCWFFPELTFVTRHGAEPWEKLAIKLMLKYPNLYYSTSAFAPKHYPKAIIDFMNTRGADKVIYAGYFPMGLSIDRIFRELGDLPLKEEVWPKFLRENALKVLGAS